MTHKNEEENVPSSDKEVNVSGSDKFPVCSACFEEFYDTPSNKKVVLKYGNHSMCYTCYIVVYKSANPRCPECKFHFLMRRLC